MDEQWKRKLSSRKFWAAVTAVALSAGVLFGIDELTMEHVTALIAAVGGLAAYILAEGSVDAAREKNENREN
ncbi:MAG: hypothetical protein IKM31_04420 [Oscillospiraceae bacterium]|nr:hypothetical protein [Oscillospiraceae bacterium]